MEPKKVNFIEVETTMVVSRSWEYGKEWEKVYQRLLSCHKRGVGSSVMLWHSRMNMSSNYVLTIKLKKERKNLNAFTIKKWFLMRHIWLM
jgi:hypothetical protein